LGTASLLVVHISTRIYRIIKHFKHGASLFADFLLFMKGERLHNRKGEKIMRLNPLDVLAKDTPVRIGNRRGKVVSCEIVPACPCGMIAVHTVELTERWKVTYSKFGRWEPLAKPSIWKGNYTAVLY
jgi:hypothetical protein